MSNALTDGHLLTEYEQTDLAVRVCPACGIHYAAPKRFFDHKRQSTGRKWYCPNGHRLGFTTSEADELRKEKARLQQRLDFRETDLRRAREQIGTEQRRTAAYKGHLTKTKRRVAAGVCPCCNRHFENLHRHMANQHPGYEQTEPEGTS